MKYDLLKERMRMNEGAMLIFKSLPPGLYSSKELLEKLNPEYPIFNSAWDLGRTLRYFGIKGRVVRRNGVNVRVYYIDFKNK